MDNHFTTAVLDIGLTQIKLVVATQSNSRLHICGAFSTPTKGIVQGEIKSSKDLMNSIKVVLERARQSQLAVNEVHVLLPNVGLTLTRQKAMRPTDIASRKVTDDLLKKVRAEINRNATKQFESYRLTAIDYVPISYTLDAGTTTSKAPIGSYTNNVLVDAYVILASQSFAVQLSEIIDSLNCTVLSMQISAFQAVYAQIRPEMLKDSVMVADIGGQTTTLYTMTNRLIEAVQVIAIGGSMLTSVLAEWWKIPYDQAESYKCLAGSAYSHDKNEVLFEPQLANQNLNEQAMANLIEDKITELAEYIQRMKKLLPTNKVIPILITGGSANLDGIETKLEMMTHVEVLNGIPLEVGGRHGQYAAAIGRLKLLLLPQS